MPGITTWSIMDCGILSSFGDRIWIGRHLRKYVNAELDKMEDADKRTSSRAFVRSSGCNINGVEAEIQI